jgi:hypothetical protein
MYLELDEVNSSLAALLGPLVLGAAAAGYLTTTGTAGASAGGILALLDRGKDFVLANAQAAAAVGAAAGVAGVATVAVVLANSGSGSPTASPPRPVVTGGLADPSTATPTPTPRKQQPRTITTSNAPLVLPATPAATSASASADSPKPKPSPTESTPDKPSSTPTSRPPTTPPPSARTADIGVRLTFSLRVGPLTRQKDGLLGYLNAGVSGIPTGQKSTITVRVLGGRLVQRGGGCRPSGSVATCALGPGAPPLEFNVMGVPVSATATVTVPSGYTDPSMANNHDSVLLGLLRLGSLRG